jgi:hypothetical protein
MSLTSHVYSATAPQTVCVPVNIGENTQESYLSVYKSALEKVLATVVGRFEVSPCDACVFFMAVSVGHEADKMRGEQRCVDLLAERFGKMLGHV